MNLSEPGEEEVEDHRASWHEAQTVVERFCKVRKQGEGWENLYKQPHTFLSEGIRDEECPYTPWLQLYNRGDTEKEVKQVCLFALVLLTRSLASVFSECIFSFVQQITSGRMARCGVRRMNNRMFVRCNLRLFEEELKRCFPLNKKKLEAALERLKEQSGTSWYGRFEAIDFLEYVDDEEDEFESSETSDYICTECFARGSMVSETLLDANLDIHCALCSKSVRKGKQYWMCSCELHTVCVPCARKKGLEEDD